MKFIMSPADAGTRLDVFLARHLPAETRSAIQKWIELHAVTVNARESKPACRLRINDRVEIQKPSNDATEAVLEPWAYPLIIVYEDEDLIAINKPSRLV